MSENVPSGYKIVDDKLINKKTSEYFFIRNRSFDEVNHRFRGAISLLVEKFKQKDPSTKVQVLDVGGGQESKAAKELSKMGVLVVNADLIARPKDKKDDFYPIPSSAFHLPFKDGTFDLLYTRQFLVYFSGSEPNQEENMILVEIARVLKPGGVAILDDDYYSYLSREKSNMDKLEKKLKVKIVKKQGGIYLNVAERIDRIFEPEMYPPGNFLIMQKLPIDEEIKRTIEKIPDKLAPWKIT